MLKDKGFTLVEILVVIAIISILASIGIVVYSRFIKGSRDVKRKADLYLIQSALEQFHADQFYYPTKDPSGGPGCSNGKVKVGCPLKSTDGSKTYLNNIPVDPLSSNPQYIYDSKKGSSSSCDNINPGSRCDNYCLYAALELSTTASPLTTNCSAYPTAAYNYLLTPP